MIALKRVRLKYPESDPGLPDVPDSQRDFFTSDTHLLTLADFTVRVECRQTGEASRFPLSNVRSMREASDVSDADAERIERMAVLP